jgi:5-methylcytosine-specific restriction endonuclease McrA
MKKTNQYGPKKLNEEIFVENSTYPRHRLKERIVKQNIIKYECECCGLGNVWNGKEIVLQLEHKNGKNNDNRIENLGFLCPNCHTQTKTYAAKNRKNKNRTPKSYIDKDGVLRNISV